MKNYLVKITFFMPAPREREVRAEATRISIAVKRAIDEARKDFKGRRIKELKIIIEEL